MSQEMLLLTEGTSIELQLLMHLVNIIPLDLEM